MLWRVDGELDGKATSAKVRASSEESARRKAASYGMVVLFVWRLADPPNHNSEDKFPKWLYAVFAGAAVTIAVAMAVIFREAKKPFPVSADLGQSRIAMSQPATRPMEMIRLSAPALPATTATVKSLPFTAQQIFANASPAVVRVIGKLDSNLYSNGSGFFANSSGLVVTNYHVIEDASDASIMLPDGSKCDVTAAVAIDQDADLAILETTAVKTPFLKISPELPMVGARAFAIGNPEGFTNTLSDGLISGIRRDRIQMTAPISHGSSGGPILDENGLVVGVAVSFWRSGENLNFAVPCSSVVNLLKRPRELVALSEIGSGKFSKIWKALEDGKAAAAADLLRNLSPSLKRGAGYFHVASAVHYSLRLFVQALEESGRALSLDPKLSGAMIIKGSCHIELGEANEAIECFSSMAQDFPDSALAHYHLGRAFAAKKLFPEAISEFQKGIRIDGSNVAIRCALGDAFKRSGKYWQSIVAYNETLKIDPKNTHALTEKGAAYLLTRDYLEAIRSLRSAIQIADNEARSHLLLGNALYRTGMKDDAKMEWETASAIDPIGQSGDNARKLLMSPPDD